MILFKRAARKQKFHVKGVDKEAMDIAFDGEVVTPPPDWLALIQLEFISGRYNGDSCRRYR